MRRLHVDSARLADDVIVVTDADYRYLVRVLRLDEGERLTLFDGKGHEAEAEIVRTGPRAVELRVHSRHDAPPQRGPELTLIQSLARGEKLDLVVQKATELGVTRIIPVTAQRSVARLDAMRSTTRHTRWQKIAREAARQCGRADVPEVEAVAPFTVAAAAAGREALKLLLWEGARHVGLRSVLPEMAPPGVVVAIGPEGGFADEEVALAREVGFTVVGLGPRILRTETAAVAALAILGYALGDLGRSS